MEELKKFTEWFLTLPKFEGEDSMGESYYMLQVDYPSFLGAVINLTEINNSPAVVFAFNGEVRYYHLKKVEMGKKDYESDGKYMRSFKVDNKFWFYDERIPNLCQTCSFGMDMDMAFLEQQQWEDITSKV